MFDADTSVCLRYFCYFENFVNIKAFLLIYVQFMQIIP